MQNVTQSRRQGAAGRPGGRGGGTGRSRPRERAAPRHVEDIMLSHGGPRAARCAATRAAISTRARGARGRRRAAQLRRKPLGKRPRPPRAPPATRMNRSWDATAALPRGVVAMIPQPRGWLALRPPAAASRSGKRRLAVFARRHSCGSAGLAPASQQPSVDAKSYSRRGARTSNGRPSGSRRRSSPSACCRRRRLGGCRDVDGVHRELR